MAEKTNTNASKRLTLVMTHQCNFDCRYCLQKHEEAYMPREIAVKAIDQLSERVERDVEKGKQSVQISFYGGEPLLARSEIEYLVEYAGSKMGSLPGVRLAFEITTNGLLLDEDFISFAKKNHIILALSHDGLMQDLSRVDRGGNPTRERVDAKLQMLLKAFPDTVVMMTVHPDLVEKLADSVLFFREKGVRCVSMVLAHGERVKWNEDKFEKLSAELEKVEAFYEENNRGDQVFRFVPFDNKIRNYIRGRDADSALCHFGGHKMMVDLDGKIYPCSHFIGRDGFCTGSVDEGVDQSRIDSLEAKRIEAEECAECALRSRCHHKCACANHGHTGSMSTVSALQCEYERLLIGLADQAAESLLKPENPRFIERMYKP